MMLAIQIRIIGKFRKPTENTTNKDSRPMRIAIDEARAHFRTLGAEVANTSIMQRLLSKMLLTEDYAVLLSKKFRDFVLSLGDYAAGDEKLWRFTDSGNVRLVLSKPDRVGFWFYELCFPLRTGKSYLSYTRLHNSTTTGQAIPTREIIQDWHVTSLFFFFGACEQFNRNLQRQILASSKRWWGQVWRER